VTPPELGAGGLKSYVYVILTGRIVPWLYLSDPFSYMKITSIQTKIGLILLAFFLLVATSVGITFWVVDHQEMDALIINVAGRQRMLSQRIVWLALSDPENADLTASMRGFEQTLWALRNGGAALDSSGRQVILPPAPLPLLQSQLEEATHTWEVLRSQIERILSLPLADPDREETERALVAGFARLIDQIDAIVGGYEAYARSKLVQVQLVQFSFFVTALALLAWGYLLIRRRILQPLDILRRASGEMGAGQLKDPIPDLGEDELGDLGRAFKTMQGEITNARDLLEERVNQRTQELLSAFEFSQEIVAELDLDHLLQSVTDRARALTSARSASLCLLDSAGVQLAQSAVSSGESLSITLDQPIEAGLSDVVIGQGETITLAADCSACSFLRSFTPGQCAATPLRAGGVTLGALCVVRGEASLFDEDETRALALLANSAAIAIANARMANAERSRAEESATLAERERMAAELHDNLAQTLGFLNLKTERIEEMLADEAVNTARDELGRMKPAIASAYGQVRAALTGLRQPSQNGEDLAQRLARSVEDFREVSGLSAELCIDDPKALALSRVTQIQVHHIVREALANVRQHAEARRAWVRVSCEDGCAVVTVEDDGCGFDAQTVNGANHLGLSIMRTRAQRQGGTLTVSSAPGNGTRIRACFRVGE
jgi:two-component system, NarL family, nitrate/nitrite sensor histidine kinase NarX